MIAAPRTFATVTPDGQIALPDAFRGRRDWGPGAQVEIVETPEGLVLRPAPFGPPKTLDEVAGMLRYDGPPRTVEEMDEAVAEMFRQRYGREYEDDDLR